MRTGAIVFAVGLAVLVGCGLVVGDGPVSEPEREVFSAINGLPDWLRGPLWVFQQTGNMAVGLGLVLVLAILLRKPRLAVAAVLAVAAKIVLARVVKSLVERQRPGTSIGDVVFHGEVPHGGLSFVSGHAVITSSMATLLMAVLPRRWRPLPWVLVGLNGFGRVYVGAHAPLDVVGGTGLGLVIGGVLYAWLAASEAGKPEDAPAPASRATPTSALAGGGDRKDRGPRRHTTNGR